MKRSTIAILAATLSASPTTKSPDTVIAINTAECVAASAAATPPTPSFSWRPLSKTLEEPETPRRLLAIVGPSLPADAALELGEFEDFHPYGEAAGERRAWHGSGYLTVLSPDSTSSARLEVDFWFDESWRLLAAATKSRSVYRASPVSSRNLQDKALEDPRIQVRPLDPGTTLVSSVDQVLAMVWKLRVHPEASGQIVVRPRLLMSPWPPVKVNDEYQGNCEYHPTWIIEVTGTDLHLTARGDDFTQMVMFLRDRDHRAFEQRFLP